MDLRQLQMFEAVLATTSITKAAERLFVTPSAVSLQLKLLSGELHADLFVRRGKRLAPTPAAVRLSHYTRDMFALVGEIRRDFGNQTDGQPFVIGTGLTTLLYQMSEPIRLLRREYPDTEIRIITGSTEDIVLGLRTRAMDLGIVSLPARADGLHLTPLFEEELVLVVCRSLYPGDAPDVPPADIAALPLIVYPKGSNTRANIDQFLRGLGIAAHVSMELDNAEAIKRLVESGYGASFLPANCIRDASPALRKLHVRGARLMRQLAIAVSETKYPRKLTGSISAFLRQALDRGRHA
jgi:DNA-binding transcriptional LysR family regulator